MEPNRQLHFPDTGTDAGDPVERIVRTLTERSFPVLAAALRKRSGVILTRWRTTSVEAMPEINRLTLADFEDAATIVLEALATALECRDAEFVRRIIQDAPQTLGLSMARLAELFTVPFLLAEDRIFRFVLVYELHGELGRVLDAEESHALHTLLDIINEHRQIALSSGTGDLAYQKKIMGLQRLAGLGTLVAGVSHETIHLFLRLNMLLEHIGNTELTPVARTDLEQVGLLVRQFQNSIVNLRWLAVDSQNAPVLTEPLDLHTWAVDVAAFHRSMLPAGVELSFDIPERMPRVRISAAALSQSVFNLIRNAQESFAVNNRTGRITVTAAEEFSGTVTLSIQDDGPGMTLYTLRHCTDFFFTSRQGGSGLGLALVRALITGAKGSIRFVSPPPASVRGTLVLLTLPADPAPLSVSP